MSGRKREGRKPSVPSSGKDRVSPPQETRDAVADDDSDTEPMKTGSRDVTRPSQLLTTKEVDLNGTTETDITDATESPRTDTEGASIAMDCPTGPAEVIVHGTNVRKIRVKFPPHPPAALSIDGLTPKPPSGRSRTRTSADGKRRTPKGSPTDEVPYSQEETPGSDQSQSSLWPASLSSGNTATSGNVSNNVVVEALSQRSISYDFGLHVGNIDMDKKFKQDMQNGIEYFENRIDELKVSNRRMVLEIERLVSLNTELENRFKDTDTRYLGLMDENEELKIKVDTLAKEKAQLEGQAVEQWEGRVKVEEMFSEMKRDSDVAVKNLRDELKGAKDKHRPTPATRASPQKTKTLDGNNMELLKKISHLQDQLAKLQMEKGLLQDSNRKTEKELHDYKVMYKDKTRELDAQYKRFLSLKKSFNDMADEHEKLKTVLRGRGIHNGVSTSGNSTWPSNKSGRLGEVETVRLVDISSKVAGTVGACQTPSYFPPAQKGAKPVRSKLLTHKRNTSEGMGSIVVEQNLPPVTTVAK